MGEDELLAATEALLFAAEGPLSENRIGEILGVEDSRAQEVVGRLREKYERHGHGIQLVKVAGGYELCTRPEYADRVEKLGRSQPERGLSQASLETLAIIAYKQPVTRAEIERIRGVKCEKPLYTLEALGLIEEVGRKDGLGRPILYGTTKQFLRCFGLADLTELPDLGEPAAEAGS